MTRTGSVAVRASAFFIEMLVENVKVPVGRADARGRWPAGTFIA